MGYGILGSPPENIAPFPSRKKCNIVLDEKQHTRARVHVEVSKAKVTRNSFLKLLLQRNRDRTSNDQQSTYALRPRQLLSQEERPKQDDQGDTELINRRHS